MHGCDAVLQSFCHREHALYVVGVCLLVWLVGCLGGWLFLLLVFCTYYIIMIYYVNVIYRLFVSLFDCVIYFIDIGMCVRAFMFLVFDQYYHI